MGMYFQYGSYIHAEAEVILSSISRSTEYSPRGEPILSRVSLAIQGVIQADSATLLGPKLDALETAYARHGQTAGLFQTGGIRTTHFLPNGTALGGVRSSGVSYPDGEGVEYVTSRTYSVTLSADYPFNGVTLLEFQETLSFVGTCGPRFVWLDTLNGPPEKQIVQQKTTQRVVQSGSALGYFNRPPPPPPLWPGNEHEKERQIVLTSPRIVFGRAVDHGISWSYSFESAVPLLGVPRTQ